MTFIEYCSRLPKNNSVLDMIPIPTIRLCEKTDFTDTFVMLTEEIVRNYFERGWRDKLTSYMKFEKLERLAEEYSSLTGERLDGTNPELLQARQLVSHYLF